jgi:multidrug resistance efflux pump
MSQENLLAAKARSTLTPDQQGSHRFKGLVRVSSVSVASILALLIATSILPPLVADQSDRAVMNAPVTLLTAPISGDVLSMQANPGALVDRGTNLAEIGNSRVDRSTAIQLDGNVAEMRERAVAVLRKRESNQAYLANLDQSIREKAAQLDQILRAQISELKANLAEADAVMEQRRLSYDQTAQLASRNVTNTNTLKPARQQLEAAQSAKDAANAKLTQKVSQLEGLSKGIYVGDDLLALAEISQKRREIEFDTQRLAIEEAELHARIRDQTRLLDIENQRLDSLAHTTIAAPLTGAVFSTSATKGRSVNAGDTLATFVDCERRFVVAIFSYRKAPDLAVGTRVEIAGIDDGGSRSGTVTEILPKTNDRFDDLYAVPFPQTERRELYVLVRPDSDPPEVSAGGDQLSTCGVGRWVTVTRANGWVPSISTVWRRGAQVLAEVFDIRPAAATVSPRKSNEEPRL